MWPYGPAISRREIASFILLKVAGELDIPPSGEYAPYGGVNAPYGGVVLIRTGHFSYGEMEPPKGALSPYGAIYASVGGVYAPYGGVTRTTT